MSLFSVMTFDLHQSKSHRPTTQDYDRINAGLAALNLRKKIRSARSGKLNQLTYNTYAAKFKGNGSEAAKKVRNRLRRQVVAIIQHVIGARGLKARVFIVVSRKWAWSRRNI